MTIEIRHSEYVKETVNWMCKSRIRVIAVQDVIELFRGSKFDHQITYAEAQAVIEALITSKDLVCGNKPWLYNRNK